MSTDSDTELVILTAVPHEMQAGIIVAALEQVGIPARPSGVLTAGFRAEAPGVVRILVRREHLAAAQSLLEGIEADDEEVDWSQVDVGDSEE